MKEQYENPYIDKLVGVPADPEMREKWHAKISDLVENIGGEEIARLEIPKTERDREIIAFAEKAVDEILQRYGRSKQVEIPIDNIHVLKKDGSGEFTKNEFTSGAASVRQKSLIADRVDSDIEFALTIFHELVHLKSYSAVQVVGSGEEQKIKAYRSGMSVVSRDYSKKYLEDYNEAVVGHLERIFYDSYIKNSPKFKNENHDSIEPFFGRQGELKELNHAVDQIFAENRDRFSSREEIFNMFIDAEINGNLMGIGRLIEKTFGSGHLRTLETLEARKNKIAEAKSKLESVYESDDDAYDSSAAGSFPRSTDGAFHRKTSRRHASVPRQSRNPSPSRSQKPILGTKTRSWKQLFGSFLGGRGGSHK